MEAGWNRGMRGPGVHITQTERLVAMGSKKQNGAWTKSAYLSSVVEAAGRGSMSLPGTSTVSGSFRTPILHFECDAATSSLLRLRLRPRRKRSLDGALSGVDMSKPCWAKSQSEFESRKGEGQTDQA